MIIPEIVKILLDAGYEDGYATEGETLVLWEHDQDPPAPLVRPDETPSAD